MNCPICGWHNVSEHRTRNAIYRCCQFVGCDWSETVPVAGQKRARRAQRGKR